MKMMQFVYINNIIDGTIPLLQNTLLASTAIEVISARLLTIEEHY